MNWSKGFSSKCYATFVDPISWKDTERFEITGGTLKRSDSGLRASADVSCVKYNQQNERLIRIWMDTEQSGSSGHTPLFTGFAEAPERDIDGVFEENPLTCYSVLKSAQDVFLPLGYYAPIGISGGQLVKQLLSSNTSAPIRIIGDLPALSQYIIAEDKENCLSMSEKILLATNGRLRVLGNGEVEIRPREVEISETFDPLNNDVIEPQLNAVNDLYSCPNVFRAVLDNTSAIARDDSLNSPLSTVNRGREVWAEEKDCDLSDDETLAEYAQRRLLEEQRHYLTISYNRRFYPDVLPSDLVALNYPAQKLVGRFYVVSQSIELGYGARTSEEVVQV